MSATKYSGRPNPKLIGVCFVLSCLLLSIVLHPAIPGAVHAEVGKLKKVNGTSRAQNQAGGCCGGDEGNNTPHVLAGTYYTINDTFSAKLLLNNKGPTAIQAQVTLFSLNGERFDAPSITVEANAHRFEDFAHWIAMAGEQFREGSIQVFHRGKDLVLGTQIYLTDVKHSLSFEEKLTERGKSGSSRLKAVWWLPTPKGVVNLVLSNTTDTVLSVSATVLGNSPKRESGTTVDIAPHATRVLDIQRDVLGREQAAMSRFGSISIDHNGGPGAVLARAMAFDASVGYSLSSHCWQVDTNISAVYDEFLWPTSY